MSALSTRFSTTAQILPTVIPASPSEELNHRLTTLYALSQRSNYVFGSPLGPFYRRGQSLHLPRFVYFGPHTHDESLRLAFLAGFDGADLRSSLALLHFVEGLVSAPDLGQGLNLSFFPLVDVIGLYHGVKNRDLTEASWLYADEPETNLLQKDARSRGYHGFVKIVANLTDEVFTVRLRGDAADLALASGVELISSEDLDPWPVRWEADSTDNTPPTGPLSLVDDLPQRPFELTVGVPVLGTAEVYREAVTSVLKRFILRYRSIQAFGQHL